MKKLICLLLISVMIFSLCACGKTAGEAMMERLRRKAETEVTETEKPEYIDPFAWSMTDKNCIVGLNRAGKTMETLVVPEHCTKIEPMALNGNTCVKEITFLAKNVELPKSAFSHCTALEYVRLPEYTKELPDYMFDSCENLKEITIPNSVTKFGDYAFRGCKKLQKIVLPGKLETIGENCFYGCEALQSLTFTEGLKEIKTGAFFGSGLKTIVLKTNVENIGDHAFSNCMKLETVRIGEGVKKLNYAAFSNCRSLKSVYLPASLEEISHDAFTEDHEFMIFVKRNSHAEETVPYLAGSENIIMKYYT